MKFLFHVSFLLALSAVCVCSSIVIDEELKQLADYWGSFSRKDDSSVLSAELFPNVWVPQVPEQSHAYKWSLQNKASPDECFHGVGTPSGVGPCPAGTVGTNKTNQGYAWSEFKTGGKVFWGTVANYLCLANLPLLIALNQTGPTVSDDVVCLNTFLPSGVPSDYRPPQAWYRKENDPFGVQTSLTAQIAAVPAAQQLLSSTLGFRAAGTANGVAIFGGASLTGLTLNLFAFNVDTGAFIGATQLPAFNDVRKFTTIQGTSYMAVFSASGRGALLRYVGGLPPANNPLAFVVVAKLEGNPAEIQVYDEDQVVVGTWATPTSTPGVNLPGKLILSPPINALPALAVANTITPAAYVALPFTAGFVQVWNATSYEPDPVTALTLGTSSLAKADDGWFYWGTFQFPPQPLAYFNQSYHPEPTTVNILKIFIGSHRATSIFRGRDFDTTPKIELLYGERYYPVYDGVTQKWTVAPNKLHATPIYGRSGFGNIANVYTWSANAYKGNVLLGTFDESYIFISLLKGLIPTELLEAGQDNLGDFFGFQSIKPGADLYVFNSQPHFPNLHNNPAKWVTLTGLSNPVNYGIRNIVNDPAEVDGDRWATTANPFNVNPVGGWEVYRFSQN